MYIKLNDLIWDTLHKYTLHNKEECLNCNDIEEIFLDLLEKIESLEEQIEDKRI